jgi:acyl transferase domain-containing protein
LEDALNLMVERVHCLQASPLQPERLTAFERVAQAVTYSSPNLGIISLSSGERVEAEMGTAFYWSRQMQQPSGHLTLEVLRQHKLEVMVEIGCPKKDHESLEIGLWLPSLSHSLEDWQTILQSLGKLYIGGGDIDWAGFDRDYCRRCLQLPTYPFQRQLCRFETSKNELEKVNN